MFGEDLDDTPAFRPRRHIPLHVSPALSEGRAKLVGLEFIRREDAK